MRDPERKIVCDVLANGFTLTTKEEIDNANATIRNAVLKKLLDDVCKQCPVREVYMPLEDYCAESCDECLVNSVVTESLHTPKIHVLKMDAPIHRDYCSDECYKKSRERKRKERREGERHSKYWKLPASDRPDGFCKICGKNISDMRVGALLCPNHTAGERRKYYRQKNKILLCAAIPA